jgi:hypothetical protein
MQKLLIVIITCLSMYQLAKADLGNGLVYEAKYYLKDGSFFKGSIEILGDGNGSYINEDGTNQYTSDEGMMVLFKKIQKLDDTWYNRDCGSLNSTTFNKVAVFKNIEEIVIKGLKHTNRSSYYESIYGFVNDTDIVYLDSNEIEKIIFWSVNEVKREWLTSEIVFAPEKMIETIQSQQYWNRLTMTDESNRDSIIFMEDIDAYGIEMINYNSDNNIPELKRLALLKLTSRLDSETYNKFLLKKYGQIDDNLSLDLKNRLLREYRKHHYHDLRKWFWKRGILILDVWGTC